MEFLYTIQIQTSLRDREVACSASDRQGSNFESCVWRTVSSQSSHHPQEVLLAQFSLYVHKGGLKPDSFHFYHMEFLYTIQIQTQSLQYEMGGGPAWKVEDRGYKPHSELQISKKKNVSFSLTRSYDLILWEPLWLRDGVLGLRVRPPGIEFRIMCQVGSVISFISPSPGGSPRPIQPICAQRWTKTPFL